MYIRSCGYRNEYVYVITPFGVLLLVYKPDTRGRVAPEGGGLINRNNTTKGVIKCLLPLLGELLRRSQFPSNSRARARSFTKKGRSERRLGNGEAKGDSSFARRWMERQRI